MEKNIHIMTHTPPHGGSYFHRINCGYSLMVKHRFSKPNMRVRFPLSAPGSSGRSPVVSRAHDDYGEASTGGYCGWSFLMGRATEIISSAVFRRTTLKKVVKKSNGGAAYAPPAHCGQP